jgi:N utilization substance protein B
VSGRSEGVKGARTTARLAAVQALYQVEFRAEDPARTVEEFRRFRLKPGLGGPDWAAADADFFKAVVEGAWSRRPEIDGLIAPALAKNWTLARIDPVLRAALRAGVYEILARPDIPARTTIGEYVELAHAFDAGAEAGFINGVLDRIARERRPAEMA